MYERCAIFKMYITFFFFQHLDVILLLERTCFKRLLFHTAYSRYRAIFVFLQRNRSSKKNVRLQRSMLSMM